MKKELEKSASDDDDDDMLDWLCRLVENTSTPQHQMTNEKKELLRFVNGFVQGAI